MVAIIELMIMDKKIKAPVKRTIRRDLSRPIIKFNNPEGALFTPHMVFKAFVNVTPTVVEPTRTSKIAITVALRPDPA
jgi:hypothetical protein